MKYIMGNLNKGTKEDFVAGLLKKFKPGSIRMLEREEDSAAIVDFPSEEAARQAVAHFEGKKYALSPFEEDADSPFAFTTRLGKPTQEIASPYCFVPRKTSKERLSRRHASLSTDALDVAFEIVWRAETPVAANPCSSGGDKSCPSKDESGYRGYDNRWLMIDNRLAISPFTVKSAIANGVAALLGSCYRVMDGDPVGHKDKLTEGTYPYTGPFKRYRVARDNSKPGILKRIDYKTGDVEIQPVEEFYYDAQHPPAGVTFDTGKEYYVRFVRMGQRNIIRKPEDISDKELTKRRPEENTAKVLYVGPYRFGMDLTLGPGDFGKGHYHRFCRLKQGTISGRISHINLLSCEAQKQKVHMGIFEKMKSTAALDPRPNKKYAGKPWHQELTTFAPEQTHDLEHNWVYYQSFNNKVTAIGKNFQFKTAFRHSETVPAGQEVCKDVTMLCPRCTLFGMVDGTGKKDRRAAGFKGRFKSAALINNLQIEPKVVKGEIRYGKERNYKVDLYQWRANGQVVSAQFLLPLMGGPKPNKRDQSAYYENGVISGAKHYRHCALSWEGLQKLVKATNQKDKIGDSPKSMDYSHELRNYAQVCREGLTFKGTVGAENCSRDEIAALLMVLDERFDDHGFKIGLGKPLGLGSVSSRIDRIWIRRPGEYKWTSFDVPTEAVKPPLPPTLQDVEKLVNQLKTAHHAIFSLRQTADVLKFPEPGIRYWRNYKNMER